MVRANALLEVSGMQMPTLGAQTQIIQHTVQPEGSLRDLCVHVDN